MQNRTGEERQTGRTDMQDPTEFEMALAKAMQPRAWALYGSDPESCTRATKEIVATSMEAARAVSAIAVPKAVEPDSIGTSLDRAVELSDEIASILAELGPQTRGDLDEVARSCSALRLELEDAKFEVACTRCGEYSNDGEGIDGLCGNCADRDENASESGRVTHIHPSVGDKVFMEIDGNVEIRIASVHERQRHLLEGFWSIRAEDGSEHLIEDEGDTWLTVGEDAAAPQPYEFHCVFHDDEDKWKGVVVDMSADEDSMESRRGTACLYSSVGAALGAALAMQDGRDPMA
jgi:hypothetical protein